MFSGVSGAGIPSRSGGVGGGPTDKDSEPSAPGTDTEAARPTVLIPISAAACAIVPTLGILEEVPDEPDGALVPLVALALLAAFGAGPGAGPEPTPPPTRGDEPPEPPFPPPPLFMFIDEPSESPPNDLRRSETPLPALPSMPPLALA